MLSSKNILKWYDQNARILPWRISPADRKIGISPDPYRVWLSEIMLQQTTIVTVIDYYLRFLIKWPNVETLAAAPLDEVLKMWAGLGYYARARNLHACAQTIDAEHQGQFPKTAQNLQNLPGIGPYTSAAIAAICYDEKVAVIDGNVDRVSARYLALTKPTREEKPQILHLIQHSVPKRAGDFAQALMDLGATICTPIKPSCTQCPITKNCSGHKTGSPAQFPIRPVKKKRPVRYGHAFILQQTSGEIFLQKRSDKGLLAKMTQVPNTSWEDKATKVFFPMPGEWQTRGNITHVFTHFQLELEVWVLLNAPASFVQEGFWLQEGFWVQASDLKNQALPTLFTKVLEGVPEFIGY